MGGRERCPWKDAVTILQEFDCLRQAKGKGISNRGQYSGHCLICFGFQLYHLQLYLSKSHGDFQHPVSLAVVSLNTKHIEFVSF